MKKDYRQKPRKVMGRQGRSLIPFAIAILVVLGLVFGGWGTVYAAQDAEPDDLLYPVKVVVDHLADITATVTTQDAAPGPKNATGVQIMKLDRDILDTDRDVGGAQIRVQNRLGEVWAVEPLLDDLDLMIDDTLTITPTITGTRTMSGSLWGPGPCFGGPENCELELTAPYGYTYTHGVDDEAPFEGDPPLGGSPATENPGDNDIGFGPGENTTKEVQEPVGNTGTTSEQKKGGK